MNPLFTGSGQIDQEHSSVSAAPDSCISHVVRFGEPQEAAETSHLIPHHGQAGFAPFTPIGESEKPLDLL